MPGDLESVALKPHKCQLPIYHEKKTTPFLLPDRMSFSEKLTTLVPTSSNFPNLKGHIATDFCGRFPDMSSRGMNYIFMLHECNSDTVLAAPTKSRKVPAMTAAHDQCYKQLTDAGLNPVLQHLDNEV